MALTRNIFPALSKVSTALLILVSGSKSLAETREVSDEIIQKVIQQGVPEKAFLHLVEFRKTHLGQTFKVPAYTCKNQKPGDDRPCHESIRTPEDREVVLPAHDYMVIVDYQKNSMEERFFVIHLPTGQVTKALVTHGKNSGDLYAYKFSNIKDSKQTSLGIYITGRTYEGHYGLTLRLYGVESSNDQAFIRDIVMHGAWYAAKTFANQLNPKTGKPFQRLGVSWGCPALELSLARQLVPVLKEGALFYQTHSELEEAAQNGAEVIGPNREIEPLATH